MVTLPWCLKRNNHPADRFAPISQVLDFIEKTIFAAAAIVVVS
jgi:hypothetical protein